jgi:hypothetical protein
MSIGIMPLTVLKNESTGMLIILKSMTASLNYIKKDAKFEYRIGQ